MKKLFFPILLIVVLISCEKIGDLKFSEAISGGCALGKGESSKGAQTTGTEGVTHSKVNGNLELVVGFNTSCCGEYSTSSQVKGDSIIINILTTKEGLCNCICYYTYNFKFVGTGANYKYRVSIDDFLSFQGKINK